MKNGPPSGGPETLKTKPCALESSTTASPPQVEPDDCSDLESYDEDSFDPPDECIALREQPETSIFWSQTGAVIIQQDRDLYQGGEDKILLLPKNVPGFIKALQSFVGLTATTYAEPCGSGTTRKPKDPTAAERQRRYRARKRSGVEREGDCDVTVERNASSDLPGLVDA